MQDICSDHAVQRYKHRHFRLPELPKSENYNYSPKRHQHRL